MHFRDIRRGTLFRQYYGDGKAGRDIFLKILPRPSGSKLYSDTYNAYVVCGGHFVYFSDTDPVCDIETLPTLLSISGVAPEDINMLGWSLGVEC